MRKYLVAAIVGGMLIAGQAAATDSAVVNVGDRVGAQSATADELFGSEAWLIYGVGVLLVGMIAWGFSQSGTGNPGSAT